MATVAIGLALGRRLRLKKRTSVGGSWYSRPLNKHKRRQWKRYRGQGR